MYEPIKKTRLLPVIMVMIFLSCTEEPLRVVKELGVEEIGTDSVYSETELQSVLDEELRFLELEKQGRIVDISGMNVIKENPKKVYVHYMPWFQSKDYDGYWGQHWTMANQDPDIIDANGKRQIASYYYPLIGPYSSSDPDLHEYHFLMMKLAGVDGVIFDWYGSRDLYDYGLIKQSTETFIAVMEDLGMDFSIMYEDRVAVHAVDQQLADSVIQAAQQDFTYIDQTYFTSPRYLKHENNNVLFVFGPEHITTEAEWNQVFSVLPVQNRPDFLTLWAAKDRVGPNAAGEFLWVAPDHLLAHQHYYSIYPQTNMVTVGSSYPGFHSFYTAGGWSTGAHAWTIPKDSGQTFVETLNYTHQEIADFIQVITWNDFGEGTMIENLRKNSALGIYSLYRNITGVAYTPNDLQVTVRSVSFQKEPSGKRYGPSPAGSVV